MLCCIVEMKLVVARKEAEFAEERAEKLAQHDDYRKKIESLYMDIQRHVTEKEKIRQSLHTSDKLYSALLGIHKRKCGEYRQLKESHHNLLSDKEDLQHSLEERLKPRTPRPEWDKIYEENSSLGAIRMNMRAFVHDSTENQVLQLMSLVNIKEREVQSMHEQFEQTLETHEDIRGKLRAAKDEIDRIRLHAPNERGHLSSLATKSGNMSKNSMYIIAYGTGPNIPLYLRHHGRVKNKKYSLHETESLTHDIWQHKSASVDNLHDMTLEDYMYVYLKDKFVISTLMAECAYNFLNSLKRYSYNSSCELFLKILNGELNEKVHDDQVNMIKQLRSFLIRVDTAYYGLKSGKLPKYLFLRSLRSFFPLKSASDYRSLIISLHVDNVRNDELFEYLQIFNSKVNVSPNAHDKPSAKAIAKVNAKNNEKGNKVNVNVNVNVDEMDFLGELCDQHLYEIQNFMNDVKRKIEENATNDDDNHMISLGDIRTLWQELDPSCNERQLNRRISIGAGCNVRAIDWEHRTNCHTFLYEVFTNILVKPMHNYDVNGQVSLADPNDKELRKFSSSTSSSLRSARNRKPSFDTNEIKQSNTPSASVKRNIFKFQTSLTSKPSRSRDKRSSSFTNVMKSKTAKERGTRGFSFSQELKPSSSPPPLSTPPPQLSPEKIGLTNANANASGIAKENAVPEPPSFAPRKPMQHHGLRKQRFLPKKSPPLQKEHTRFSF